MQTAFNHMGSRVMSELVQPGCRFTEPAMASYRCSCVNSALPSPHLLTSRLPAAVRRTMTTVSWEQGLLAHWALVLCMRIRDVTSG